MRALVPCRGHDRARALFHQKKKQQFTRSRGQWVDPLERRVDDAGRVGDAGLFYDAEAEDDKTTTSERPRVSALSDAAHRDARAPRPAPTHPTTRPVTYLDVPSLLERTASARCRLPVHVDTPPVLSKARRWVS